MRKICLLSIVVAIILSLTACAGSMKSLSKAEIDEAVKTVEEIYSPLNGEVLAVNERLEEQPELVNQSPFADGWFVKVKLEDESDLANLLDAEAYLAMVGE